MTDKLVPRELEGFNVGMNDVDNIKKLPSNVLNYLHNAYPDSSLKPMNGVKDVVSTTTHVNSVAGIYLPTYLHVFKDDIDFVFVISKETPSTYNAYNAWRVEVWNVTDGTRHQWFEYENSDARGPMVWGGAQFEGPQNYNMEFSFTKRYGSVYLTMSHRVTWDTQKSIEKFEVKNKIFDWNSTTQLWEQRAMGIDVVPKANLWDTFATNLATYQASTFYDTTVHNGKLYRTGGYVDGDWSGPIVVDNHLYYTEDGVNWKIHSLLPVEYVVGCQIISFKGELYFFAARHASYASYSDNIYRYDAIEGWVQHNANPPWGDMEGFQVVVYDNKVWVMGGRYSDGTLADDIYYNTVYSSSDLTSWTTVTSTAIAGFDGFAYQGSVVYDNKMWIIGGVFDDGVGTVEPKKAVYSSTDGSTWTNVGTLPTTGTGRHCFGIAVFDGKMYIAGGYSQWVGLWIGTNLFDTQHTTDGVTWTAVGSFSGDLTTYTSKLNLYNGYLVLTLNETSWISSDGSTFSKDVGGLSFDKYYSYAFTYVKRTDSDSKLADDFEFGSVPTKYNFTKWETIQGRTVVSPDEKLLTGTITVSGANVTGTGTLFSTECAVNDYIRIGGTYKYYKIATITNNTTMTITNTLSDAYTGKEFTLLPAVGDSITTSVYHTGVLEGVEDINNRFTVFSGESSVAAGYGHVIEIPKRVYDQTDGIWYEGGVKQGATHIRIYRTLGHATKSVAEGLPHRYIGDVNLTGDDKECDSILYIDRTSDEYLTGVTNFLEMTPYSAPPLARYSYWFNDILWLAGITEYDVIDYYDGGDDDSFNVIEGRVYYSVDPASGDVSFDALSPQKFGSMFRLDTDYKNCDPDDGTKSTGFGDCAGDFYIFKENSIYMLRNGDTKNNPEKISKLIGCVCPHTITKAEIPILGGEILFFYSGEGWAYIMPGGTVKLFIDFKISDIQKTGGILTRGATGETDQPTDWYSRTKVSASFWDDTLWMFYGDNQDDLSQINEGASSNGTLKVCGFHFSPDQESNGPFIRDFSSIATKYEPQMLVPVDNSRAYTLSHIKPASSREYRLTRWNDPTQYIDTLDEGGSPTTYSNNMKIITRAYSSEPEGLIEWLCKQVMIHMDFEDEETFTIKIYTDVNKQVATCSFSQVRNSGMTQYSDNQYRDFITITTQQDLRHAFYHHLEITKQIPSSGDLELHGIRFALCDKLERVDPEHSDSFGSASNVTFVVEADASPEVNAHA